MALRKLPSTATGIKPKRMPSTSANKGAMKKLPSTKASGFSKAYQVQKATQKAKSGLNMKKVKPTTKIY